MEKKNNYYVYILKCKDGSLYTGYTNDLEKRISRHESGKGAKYTRGRGPFQLVYYRSFATKQEALQQEYRIKKLPKIQKKRLIKSYTEGHDE
ncbi:GIY-YIG nuclease family protein [Sediminibacillus albus]|uniref:Putative endonuclease n=1 Tax=Sediminibacillus albus TaxID=407036 RepID=A0A1G9D7G5_9BACI|nr:GIY-YIG nuclease family protein [Sediminibacillus albus]SDK59829.1 putative endonuclease [Sediminibacillus albus]